MINLRLEGRSLDRKDWWGFGTSDPFLTILRAGEYGQWRVVHRTEVKKGNLNPCWEPMELTLSSLCNADHHRPLKLTVEDWNKSGSHSMIGRTGKFLGMVSIGGVGRARQRSIRGRVFRGRWGEAEDIGGGVGVG